MKNYKFIILILVIVLGCKKPFSQDAETALALPLEFGTITESVVFIAGFDEGDNTYYTNAKQYFEGTGIQLVEGLFSIEEILEYINTKAEKETIFDEIHIVSHSNAWLGMSLKTTKIGERITLKTLQDYQESQQVLKIFNGISNNTKIIFHSCGLGENTALLKELQHTFTTQEAPTVYASTLFNIFGGKYAGHYLAKPYYGYYPTAESPGPAQLSNQFARSYPEIEIDWFMALKTREEPAFGEAYSFKFNIPVDWEFTFENKENMPKLEDRDAIMDWISQSPEMAAILFKLNIPIEKYRWRSSVNGNTLRIKGKTTVLCVLAPVLDKNADNEYQSIKLDDRSLYQIL